MTGCNGWNRQKHLWLILIYILVLFICISVNEALRKVDIPDFLKVAYDFLSNRTIANVTVILMAILATFNCCKGALKRKYVDFDLLYWPALAVTLLLVFDAWEYVPICGFLNYRWLGVIMFGCIIMVGILSKIPAVSKFIDRKKEGGKTASAVKVEAFSFEVSTKPEDHQDTEWDAFVANLIQRVKSSDTTKESFAVGITGTWGEGKVNNHNSVCTKRPGKIPLLQNLILQKWRQRRTIMRRSCRTTSLPAKAVA